MTTIAVVVVAYQINTYNLFTTMIIVIDYRVNYCNGRHVHPSPIIQLLVNSNNS